MQKVKVKQVEKQKLSLEVDLQKVKVEQVEKQKLGLEMDLQKTKVEHVEEGSNKDVKVEIVDQIYNQRFQKCMDYCCIKKSILCDVASRSFKKARD